ncbi:endonuclease/exonuclease/phosphatase family protein [Pseudobacteriovorax antillogorgiicola]|uniref:Endonuclease/Exonuclease/phosphatase family protein n=1 Tax=Pseudobacteriovorax antillogorgiicola TaxID=1513793 RepID=A0A1Y6CQX6_9BACT|nr:hypothetical protein [Pseudobacteriovorax antillogorgiicola]TCS41574.1 hypothetical protein EDD56_14713 [Pseudobacteriovorax antillogorgiicola]SMF83316.1 hypothetical protein SAMN06296036_1464 [Pseudobacteriovorax antillogorgiicola]
MRLALALKNYEVVVLVCLTFGSSACKQLDVQMPLRQKTDTSDSSDKPSSKNDRPDPAQPKDQSPDPEQNQEKPSSNPGNVEPEPPKTFRASTFNVDYRNKNFEQISDVINSVRADQPYIVGTQENQEPEAIAGTSSLGLTKLGKGVGDNSLYYSSDFKLVNQGQVDIDRDGHAERSLVWSVYVIGEKQVVVFNTHLPHGAISDVPSESPAPADAHAKTAQMLLNIWQSEFAGSAAVVLCDCNTGKVAGQSFTEALTQGTSFQLAQESGLDRVFFTKDALIEVNSGVGGFATEEYHRVTWAEFSFKN